MYFNYKDYFSYVLLAVVDAENFLWMSAQMGKNVIPQYSRSRTFEKLNNGTWKPRPLYETLQKDMSYVLFGDEAFPLSTDLLIPFRSTHLDYRLSRARRYVECDFGILANKWTILHWPLDVHPDKTIEIVKASTVLSSKTTIWTLKIFSMRENTWCKNMYN